MKLVVMGLGLMGGSLALELRKNGWAKEIIGIDTNLQHQKEALTLRLVDRFVSRVSECPEADLFVLAIPVSKIVAELPKVLNEIGARSTVTDLGSTKESLVQSVSSHPKRAQYVAFHPMAGTENSGPSAAVVGLFENKTGVLCDVAQSGSQHLKKIETIFTSLKMRLVYMASSEHDQHAAFVSHLSHISSFVLANTVLDKEKNSKAIFDLAGGGFESTVRLAKSSPEMWAPIFQQNGPNVLTALDAYIHHLQQFKKALTANKEKPVIDLMENANRIRQVLDKLNQKASPK